MKRIDSPIPQFPGHVVLPDYYLFDRVIPWDEAFSENLSERGMIGAKVAAEAIPPMVEEWHIDGITNGVIPATPRVPAIKLITWLIDEIQRVIEGADAVNPPTGGASTNG
jgi:hypothetical protein